MLQTGCVAALCSQLKVVDDADEDGDRDEQVWIANGGLHLVPLSDSSADISPEDAPPLSVNEALKAVRSPAVDTLATPALQSSVFARCTPKDGAALEEQVSTLVGEASLRKVALLPSQVAKALAYDPALAALAVQAFYTRDPFALKVRIFLPCLSTPNAAADSAAL